MNGRSQHVGAYVIAVEAARMLVIRKARGPYTGLWDLPGGRIEHGESPMQAALRELAEETGLSPDPAGLRLVDVWSHVASWNEGSTGAAEIHHLGVVFRAEKVIGELLTGGDGQDASSVQWVLLTELTEQSASPFAARTAALMLDISRR